jgi:hypothetical protein
MTSRNTSINLSLLHSDLLVVKELVYDKCGFDLTDLKVDKESVEYGACTFRLNGMVIRHRVSKITPTKTGQFVTVWKRNLKGETEPFDNSDDFDFIVITARSDSNLGQFIFPKSALLHNGIISGKNIEGKRGIRVYPPWDQATSKQAEKTQYWQTKYFLTTNANRSTDLATARKLFDRC